MSQLSELALQIALTQVGNKENPIGSNWGHPVQDYLASVDIYIPSSWCMAFVFWCFQEAKKALQLKLQAEGVVMPIRTGGVLDAWRRSSVEHRIFVADSGNPPRPGDIFIMDLGRGLGHTGIVQSVGTDGTLHTIEGNTNDTGSREGIEVDKKIRHNQKPIIGYLRF